MEQKFFCWNRVENGANLSSEEKELLTFTYKTLPAVTFLTMWIPNIMFPPDLLQSEIATLQGSEGARSIPGDLQLGIHFDPFKALCNRGCRSYSTKSVAIKTMHK